MGRSPLTTLTFHTPSKSCGARAYNGQRVEMLNRRYRKKVRRMGNKYANVFHVMSTADGVCWWAIEDELFITP